MAISTAKRYSRIPARVHRASLIVPTEVEEEEDEVVELTAGFDVSRVGLGLWMPLRRPEGILVVKQVAVDTWAFNAGIEVGSEVLELNGMDVSGMGAEELKHLMQNRPLNLKLRRPVSEEWRKVDFFQKDNIRLALRVSHLQQALQQEHQRAVQRDQDPDDITQYPDFKWWAAPRTHLQDRLFKAEGEVSLAKEENRIAVEIAEAHFKQTEAECLAKMRQEQQAEKTSPSGAAAGEGWQGREELEAELRSAVLSEQQLFASTQKLSQELLQASEVAAEERSRAEEFRESRDSAREEAQSKQEEAPASAASDEKQQLEQSLEEARRELAQLKEEATTNTPSDEQQQQLEQSLQEARRELARLKEDRTSVELGDRSVAEEEKQQLLQSLEEARGEFAQMKADLASDQEECQALREKATEANVARTKMSEELSEAESRLESQAKAAQTRLAAELAAAEGKVAADKEESVAHLQEEMARCDAERQAYREEVSNQGAKLSEAEASLRHEATAHTRLQQDHRQMEAKLHGQLRRQTALQDSLAAAEAKMGAESRAECDSLLAELAAARSELQEQGSMLREREERAQSLEEALLGAEEKLQHLQWAGGRASLRATSGEGGEPERPVIKF